MSSLLPLVKFWWDPWTGNAAQSAPFSLKEEKLQESKTPPNLSMLNIALSASRAAPVVKPNSEHTSVVVPNTKGADDPFF